MKKKKKRSSKKRCFFTSMVVTLLFCILITGIIVVDINTRKTGFAGQTLDSEVTPQEKSSLQLFEIPINLDSQLIQKTKKTISDAYIFVPAPFRLLNQGVKALEESTRQLDNLFNNKK